MASTTSFRTYGDRQTAMNLKYLSDRLLDRVKQEMSWNNIPHLKRSFIVQPCAMSPLGAEVVISSCYGVDNIHVYVPEAPIEAPAVEYKEEQKVYLHLKIFPILETERTGYSLVWDLNDNAFPAFDFGISGIVPTSTIGNFESKTRKDSNHVYPISDEENEEFNDIFRENVFDVYDPGLSEYTKIQVIEDLTNTLSGFLDHGQSYEEVPSVPSETTSTTNNVVSDPYPFPTPDVPAGPYPAFVSGYNVSDWVADTTQIDASGASATNTHADTNYGKKVDGDVAAVQRTKTIPSRTSSYTTHTQAKITPDIWYPQYNAWNTSIADGLYVDGYITTILQELEEAYVIECANYNHLMRFLYDSQNSGRYYFNYLFDNWNKLPILPSFAIRSKIPNSYRDLYFHCKASLSKTITDNQTTAQTQIDSLFTYWSVYGGVSGHFDEPYIFSQIGNSYPWSYDFESTGTFELFTPIGSIGILECSKVVAWKRTQDPYYPFPSEEEGGQGSATITQKEGVDTFFYGRPNYLAEFGDKAQAHVYTYDYVNIHASYENPLPTPYLWQPGAPVTKDARDLLVGAAFGFNPSGDPRELKRNEKLELAVKELFTTYYAQNGLDDTMTDEDYKVQLELRVGKVEVKEE